MAWYNYVEWLDTIYEVLVYFSSKPMFYLFCNLQKMVLDPNKSGQNTDFRMSISIINNLTFKNQTKLVFMLNICEIYDNYDCK